MKRSLAAFAAALLLPAAATAETAALRYTATWAGLPAAEIRLELDESGGQYASRIDVRTTGLPRLLSRFQARVTSAGSLEPAVEPERYRAVYQLRRKQKVAGLDFVPDGAARLAVKAAEDTSTHQQLEASFRRGVLDPLAALSALRARLRVQGPRNPQAATVQVYDGKRRFDVVARYVGPAQFTALGEPLAALRYQVMLQPVAGFKADADEDEDPEDKPREVDLLLRDDASLTVLRLSVPIVLLPAVVTFAGECSAAVPCQLAFDGGK